MTDPESNLIYLKPTQFVKHGGGMIIDDTRNAQLLIKWIEQGANYNEHRQLKGVEVNPERFIATKVGDKTPLEVVAHFDDGLARDVTDLTQFVCRTSRWSRSIRRARHTRSLRGRVVLILQLNQEDVHRTRNSVGLHVMGFHDQRNQKSR